MSVKLRIYLSFLLLGALFVLNGAVTIFTLSNNRKLAVHIKTVTEPSLRELHDLHKAVIHSKGYITGLIFLPSQKDRDSLVHIHNVSYPRLKANLSKLAAQWKSSKNYDSLQVMFAAFEQLFSGEQKIMGLLRNSSDYETVAGKEAEIILKEQVLPQTDAAITTLLGVIAEERRVSGTEQAKLERSYQTLWLLILILSISTVGIGWFFARYFTGIIVKPVHRIRELVDNLSRGNTKKISNHGNDEIGQMIKAVNHLSGRLEHTAVFAQQVGERNFDVSFAPVSEEDVLGKALVAMRDKLKSVDESLNQAQHIARLGSWEWDLRTDTMFWSDELYHIFGLDKQNFIPSFDSVMEFIHPEDKQDALAELDRLIKQHQPFTRELRIIRSGGEIRHIYVKIDFLSDGKNVTRLFGILQDISDRKQKEQELKQFTERFHLLSKATNDSIWDWNLVTDEVWWNEHFYKAFNYNPADGIPTVGQWITKLYPEDRDFMISKLKSLRCTKTDSWQGEFRYIRTDGSMGIALNKAYVLRDEQNRPLRVIGSIQDITERKNAEQKIADSEKRYRQIVETAQEGIWMIDENNYTVFVNKRICEMLGYTQEEMLGKQNYDFKEESERARAAEQIQRRKKGISETHETSYIAKSGKRIFAQVSTNPVFDEQGNYKGALAMVTDITERKKQDELLKRSEADLEKKNRLLEQKNRELEQFAYITSHDLQEPLRTISSFVDRFQQQYKDRLDDTAQKFLYYILQGSERMKVLIKDLLDYSRIGRAKQLASVDCNEILNTVLADLNKAIDESRVEIKTGRLPVIHAYNTEIKQLFQNLIINAIKFRKKEVAPLIEIGSQPIEGGWKFSIRDNGIGIPEEHNERIFIIFQRLHTRNEYEGSGIGLSHCKKIVELHGGKIWVQSTPGEGSTFHFTILEHQN